jgi:L-lactate dehydrogenase
MLLRGSCHEIVLVEKYGKECQRRAAGVAADLSHGAVLCPPTRIWAGSYQDLADAEVVAITAGINERTGQAIDRGDKRGRLLLLPVNAEIYREIIPILIQAAPKAVILVVTDPPDPLADIARKFVRKLKAKNPVLSSGTFLDTLRFRWQLALRLNCHPSSVDALVLGEHGTSQVYVWSSARIGGESVLARVPKKKGAAKRFRSEVEQAVKYANINIIEGTGASQHGIGIVTARLVEAILRDEGLVAPIGVYQPEFRVTLSLPAIIGRGGVSRILKPELSAKERKGLKASAAAIAASLANLVRSDHVRRAENNQSTLPSLLQTDY